MERMETIVNGAAASGGALEEAHGGRDAGGKRRVEIPTGQLNVSLLHPVREDQCPPGCDDTRSTFARSDHRSERLAGQGRFAETPVASGGADPNRRAERRSPGVQRVASHGVRAQPQSHLTVARTTRRG